MSILITFFFSLVLFLISAFATIQVGEDSVEIKDLIAPPSNIENISVSSFAG
jgi:hypothetical protein